MWQELQPIIAKLPPGYSIEMAGSIEEAGKDRTVMLPLFPIMIALTLIVIILQVRSITGMVIVFLTSPLGLIGSVPTLILFQQPFGINALSGILMRNTLIDGTFLLPSCHLLVYSLKCPTGWLQNLSRYLF